MEEINLQKYSLKFEIQYVQFMVELLKPYVEFEQFNTTESTVNLAGESVLKKGLKMFLKKENGIQESIDANQFIQFIQGDFPYIIQEKINMYKGELDKEEKEKKNFEITTTSHGRYGSRRCPEGMDVHEYLEKKKYYEEITDLEGNSIKAEENKPVTTYTRYLLKMRPLRIKSNNLENIKKVYWDRIKTIEGVLHFLNNVKDHYNFNQ